MLIRVLLIATIATPLTACDKDICAVPDKSVALATDVAELTPAAVADLITRDPSAVIVDVNPRGIYDDGHVPGARWMSSSKLDYDNLPADRNVPLVFYCYNEVCGASHQAASAAAERGWRRVSPLCQRRLRQSLPDICVPSGGEWFRASAQANPSSKSRDRPGAGAAQAA